MESDSKTQKEEPKSQTKRSKDKWRKRQEKKRDGENMTERRKRQRGAKFKQQPAFRDFAAVAFWVSLIVIPQSKMSPLHPARLERSIPQCGAVLRPHLLAASARYWHPRGFRALSKGWQVERAAVRRCLWSTSTSENEKR